MLVLIGCEQSTEHQHPVVSAIKGIDSIQSLQKNTYLIKVPTGIGQIKVDLPANTTLNISLFYQDKPFGGLEGASCLTKNKSLFIEKQAPNQLTVKSQQTSHCILQIIDWYR